MEELYGLHSTTGFSDHHHQNMADDDHHHHHHLGSAISPATYHHSPFSFPAASNMLVSDHFFSASSAVSDAVSVQRGSEEEISSAIRAKIVSHPLYPKLLQAYIDCQKVGAPPEIACALDEIRRETDVSKRTAVVSSCLGADPELDDFMEAYCDVLVRHRSDLSKTFDEATSFLSNIEAQLSNLCCNNNVNASRSYVSDEAAGSSEDDISGGETEAQDCPRRDEDRELKDKLLRKYSGYISTLKHEFSKKKKKGKLPREAKQTLLDWWSSHYKWPYPTEVDKVLLAESTGLDQKQISNWFINQRKRHWKPSENMQFAAMDSLYGPYFTTD